MGHNTATWTTLEDIMLELKKAGTIIPTSIIEDLRSAKSLIELSCASSNHANLAQKSEEYLANVEAFLINEGEKVFGAEKVNEWLRKLESHNVPYCQKTGRIGDKFVTGVPRDQKWVRIEPMGEWTSEKIYEIAKVQNLTIIPQNDSKLLLYGQPENLKLFVKKMAQEKEKQ